MRIPQHFNGIESMQRLVIIGAGGFGREVAWLAEQTLGEGFAVLFVVDDGYLISREIDGHPVLRLSEYAPVEGDRITIAVGDPRHRAAIAARWEANGAAPATLVHPRVEASRRVEFGAGSVVCAGSIITTGVTLGRYVHVNLDCTIGHDAVLGDFATLAPGVHISGNVHIGPRAFIGTGAVVVDGRSGAPLTIGEDAVIAAGACVIRDVPPGSMVAGVPAVQKSPPIANGRPEATR